MAGDVWGARRPKLHSVEHPLEFRLDLFSASKRWGRRSDVVRNRYRPWILVQFTYPATPEAARHLRRRIRESAAGDSIARQVVATELFLTVARHADRLVTVDIRNEGSMRIEISDGSSLSAAISQLTDPGNWSRQIIEGMSSRWGYERRSAQRVLWVEFDQETSRR